MFFIFQRIEVNELISIKYSLIVHNDSTVQTPKGILLPPASSSTMFNSKDSKDSKDFIFSQKFHQMISFSFITTPKKNKTKKTKTKTEKVLRPPSKNGIAQS